MVEKSPSAVATHTWCSRAGATPADSADDGLSILRHEKFDLVIVDITSLSEDGFAFIRRLRSAKNDTPLVALTQGHSSDRVRALGLGADDAVTTPIDPDELQARMRAVVRRRRGYSQSLLQVGDLSLAIETREARFQDQLLKLSEKEYAMLELLVLRRGQTITKDMFLNHLYGGLDAPEPKLMDVFICKLRKKLDAVGGDGLIATVWGNGYTIRCPNVTKLPVGVSDHCDGRLTVRSSVTITPFHSRPSSDRSGVADQARSRWATLPPQRMVRH